ncbi:helix-turn-helix domain-containing protein [Paenibacillus sp. CAU 1782]
MHLPVPQWLSYVHWQRKEHFLLAEDTYEDWVMFIIEEGSFSFRIGLHEGVGEPGDVIICPPHHRFCRETLSPLSFHFVVFGLEGLNVNAGMELPHIPTGHIKLVKGRQRLEDNQIKLAQAASLHALSPDAYREHILMDIWYLIVNERHSEGGPIGQGAVSPQMEEAADMLRKQALTGGDIRTVAEALGLTSVQLTRRFQAAFHQTPIRYVTSVRIEKACRLLAGTDRTLDDIAQACGYENGFYLSRVFKKQINMRPSDYRKTHRL